MHDSVKAIRLQRKAVQAEQHFFFFYGAQIVIGLSLLFLTVYYRFPIPVVVPYDVVLSDRDVSKQKSWITSVTIFNPR